MYSSNNDNNSNGVLRSPSVSSASGSGSGSNDASTSISSATTIITNVGSMTGGLGGSSGVSDVKLKRFLEHNQRLKEQLEMRRITVSEASQSLIKFVTSTKDSLMPNQWGNASSDPFLKQSSGCCTVS
ncbi:hypothetical protein BGZ54_006983 [Gamsiella multidivaricata]|nr:hypothetical protein BGZ54_006983 [Gamsiella multidivaricata]